MQDAQRELEENTIAINIKFLISINHTFYFLKLYIKIIKRPN